MSSFTVCSFNVGTDENDYRNTYNLYKQDLDQPFLDMYSKAQKNTSKLLENKAHVYCLQEVKNLDRPILNFVKNKHFECICGNVNSDAAVFLDKRRFRDIINRSFMDLMNNADVAVAVATDIKTGEKVAFASAHVPGFPWSKIKNSEVTCSGLDHCELIANKLSSYAYTIIGADMNANPEDLGDRFKVFTDKNYTIQRTNTSTNVNQEIPNFRELDYFFIKTLTKTYSFWKSIKSLFFSTFDQYSSRICTTKPLEDFNPNKLASDHRPIFMTVTPQFHTPLWRRCINWLVGKS